MTARRLLLIAALASVVGAACGDNPRRSSDDDDDAGATTTGVGGAGGIDAATTTATTTGQGGGTTDGDSLFPLALGNLWTYDVAPVGSGAVCASGSHDAEVIGQSTLDGRDAYEVSAWCAAAGSTQLSPAMGDEVHLYYQGDWLRMIAEPLEEGYSWDYFNTSYTWQNEAEVTVPAGTFTNCWTAVQNVSYTAYQTYCRGVGLVRSYSEDLAGNGWDAQLSSYAL